MEFGVLGPLMVRDGDSLFPVGGPKQRTLLALLIAAGGAPVSTDSLLMGVYGPDAQPESRRSLQTYVWMVRRVLGDMVRSEGDGYVLAIDREAIDAVRFEKALAAARTMVDEQATYDLLEESLGLWRGAAYGDVELHGRLRVEAQRLEELRAEAFETRIELDLAGGRHREVVAELEAAIAEAPLRERLRHLYMVALYRSGRQAEALRAFREAAKSLRDDLGLDPSPELQELESRILRQDRSLDYRPRPSPRPLPARYASFVGRDADVDDIASLFSDHRLVTLTGPGGIGKSSLAVEVARQLAETMVVAYVPVEHNRDADLPWLTAGSVGVLDPGDDAGQRAVGAIGEQSMVIVFDGCEHVIDAMPGLVSEILRGCPNARVLVTSREGLFISGERLLHVTPLPHGAGSASNELFLDRGGLRLEDLDEDDVNRVTEIGDRLSGVPLALELAAARLRTTSLADLAAGLEDQMSLLVSKRRANAAHRSFAATLDLSYESLDAELRRIFRHLGVFQSRFPAAGAAVVTDVDMVGGRLQELVDLSLVQPLDADDRYSLLEPIRQYAEALLAEAGELEPALLRHARWTAMFWREEHLAFERKRTERFFDLLREFGPEAVQVAERSLEAGTPDVALSIVASLARRWSSRLDGSHLRKVALRALDHPLATHDDTYLRALAYTGWLHRIADPEVAREILRHLGEAVETTSDVETLAAITEMRASLPQVIDNRVLDASTAAVSLELQAEFLGYVEALGRPYEDHIYNRLILLHEVGRMDEADALLDRLETWAEEVDPSHRGDVLHHRATHARIHGRFDEAAELLREEARLALEVRDDETVLEADRELIIVLTRGGRAEEALAAIDHYNESASALGRPPLEQTNPDVAAATMAALGRWDGFERLLRSWVGQSMAWRTDERTWTAFLAGRYVVPSRLVFLLMPTAQWLVKARREAEAATLLASAPMAYRETRFPYWTSMGEATRAKKLADQISGHAPVEAVDSLDGLFWLVAGFVGRDRPSREQ